MSKRACGRCGAAGGLTDVFCSKCGAQLELEGARTPKSKLPGRRMSFLLLGLGLVALAAIPLLKAAPRKAIDDRQAAKTAAKPCQSNDLQCRGDSAVVYAGLNCQDPIERMAKFEMKWTDGTFDTKFTQFKWSNQHGGPITMLGDRAKFQNGFGAFSNVIYECDLGAGDREVIAVRVREGRL